MKNTKRSLMSSAIALLLCFSMLLGTTYAWFTDSASSAGNIIQSGNLDIEMQWSENLEDWNDVDGDPIFTYDNWEPGYTDVKYVKVKNVGSLAFKWQLNIEAEGDVGELAEVIDVYYINAPAAKITSLDGLTSVGILSDVITNKVSMGGNLLPVNAVTDATTPADYLIGETVVAIAFHMDEEAGNKYQDKSIGDGFDVTLIATQLSFESDSFGNEYDVNATWPHTVVVNKTTVTTAVDVTTDGKVANAVAMSDGDKTSANIPAGVKLANGANELTLTITPLDKSAANVVLNENEAMMSLDVHIDGVADDNDVVMAIERKALLPIGLNMGNYRFYHVENGATVEMTLRADGATPVHNNYDYDPATGDVVLYLKSFSEVALLSEPDGAWEGGIAERFTAGTGTANDPYIIANADQFAYFSKIVSEKNEEYGDACYKLVVDLDLNGVAVRDANEKNGVFYPVGYWKSSGNDKNSAGESYYKYGGAFGGVFDGNGRTIKNIYQNTWLMDGNYDNGYWDDAMGLFGYVYGGTVKNLTVKDFESDGEFTPTGVIAAYAAGNAIFENISIISCNPRVYNTGNGGIIGIAGDSKSEAEDGMNETTVTLRNITVDQTNKISALWGSWDVACGGLVGMFRGYSNLNMENCHVAAQIDVNNDVCANYQYYWYRYAGMFIGSVRRNTTAGNYTVADTEHITATGCTYTLGDWNEYWYCELVKNSLASYTHDHQFSRLTKISKLSEIQDAKGNWTKEGNFVIPAADNSSATCYHIFKNSEGELYQHFHNVPDESNPDIYENKDVNGDGVIDNNDLKEDRTCYFMPFNQLMTGDGWGVKAFYSDSEFNRDDLKFDLKSDGTVISRKKFEVVENVRDSFAPGDEITIDTLFKSIVDPTMLSTTSIFVSVSPNENAALGKVATATYELNISNWTKSTIEFSEDCNCDVKITITDYFYCTETEVVLKVNLGPTTPDDEFN